MNNCYFTLRSIGAMLLLLLATASFAAENQLEFYHHKRSRVYTVKEGRLIHVRHTPSQGDSTFHLGRIESLGNQGMILNLGQGREDYFIPYESIVKAKIRPGDRATAAVVGTVTLSAAILTFSVMLGGCYFSDFIYFEGWKSFSFGEAENWNFRVVNVHRRNGRKSDTKRTIIMDSNPWWYGGPSGGQDDYYPGN